MIKDFEFMDIKTESYDQLIEKADRNARRMVEQHQANGPKDSAYAGILEVLLFELVLHRDGLEQ